MMIPGHWEEHSLIINAIGDNDLGSGMFSTYHQPHLLEIGKQHCTALIEKLSYFGEIKNKYMNKFD